MADSTINFTAPLVDTISLSWITQRLPSEGNMAWEYNPFRNYRLTEAKYYFRNRYWSKEELAAELGVDSDEINETADWSQFSTKYYANGIKDNEEDPVFYDVGELVDFDTEELSFDINHPVEIIPQWSYDGSINLIMNDGINPPRLINSRFSPLGRGTYQIVDRKGNNDTNIYDQGTQFDSDTSLYKTYKGIPTLEFVKVYQNGDLPVGNYHFYFRYFDADGNETDFVAESGLVTIFKGNTYGNIHTGFVDEDSYKSVKFILDNVDSAYQYVSVYYTRTSADVNENYTTTAYKINQKYLVNESLVCQIYITGNEEVEEISVDDINPQYLIADWVYTQAVCQNMLFFGNIREEILDYKELLDLSLRFVAYPIREVDYTPVSHDYDSTNVGNYIDPTFIYNYTGYMEHEVYRFGIVYIKENGSLSPVFNIRGMYFNANNQSYTYYPLYTVETDDEGNTVGGAEPERNYIVYNEATGIMYQDSSDGSSVTSSTLENVYGIVRLHTQQSDAVDETRSVLGIQICTQDTELLYQSLKDLGVKGYFFVRQKRKPLRLCQAYVIGTDLESHTPLLYVDKNSTTINSSSVDDNTTSDDTAMLIAERFLTDDKKLVHNLADRLYALSTVDTNQFCAICPEYDVDYSYYNTLFCGDSYVVEQATEQQALVQDKVEDRHFYLDNPQWTSHSDAYYTNTNVLGVEDNVKIVEVNQKLFSTRAGEAEEGFRFEYINTEVKTTDATNVLRGSWGPILAFSGYNRIGTLVNIYLQDYTTMDLQDLFKIRINDRSPFYAISERLDIEDIPVEERAKPEEDTSSEVATTTIIISGQKYENGDTEKIVGTFYRGDTYICTFTHRMNRNFQDPSAPINHKIVDEDCWDDNFKVEDGVINTDKFESINLGDLNAVKIGMWVTFSFVSTWNLNIRSFDESNVDEDTLTGHARGFYPNYGMSADGSYKTPEALCWNQGFSTSLSERYNFEVPDVPAIKNDFTNRIAYSDVHVSDSFKNGFRTFQGTHYRDYPKTYGQITKLLEYQGNLMCVFEHGVAIISVNERTVAAEGAQGMAYINTSNVLPENPKVLSDTYGSQWRDSVIQTPAAIYGVDTVAKRIWRASAAGFEIISDYKVNEFLINNISLSERELDPIIGIRDVKSHYNAYKQDVMFTFYDNLYGFEERVWNLCFSERLNTWITFYSWVPSFSENAYSAYFSFNRDTSKWIAKLGISKAGNDFSDGVCLDDNIIRLTEDNAVPIWETSSTGTAYTVPKDTFTGYRSVILANDEEEIYFSAITGDTTAIGQYTVTNGTLQSFVINTEKGSSVTYTGYWKYIYFFYGLGDDMKEYRVVFEEDPVVVTIGSGSTILLQYYTNIERDAIVAEKEANGEDLTDEDQERYYFTVASLNTSNVEPKCIGKLSLENRSLPTGDDVEVTVTFSLERDNFQNYKNFEIRYGDENGDDTEHQYLWLTARYSDICSELWQRMDEDGNVYTTAGTERWVYGIYHDYMIYKNDLGRRVSLAQTYNADRIVSLLNIRANISVSYDAQINSLKEAYVSGFSNGVEVDAGYYESVVAVMPYYNMQFLTTDFWKHGQACTIDITDKIYPTYWYGKQHPFEFEFVVNVYPDTHKIFDNLEIISNSAEPESFHYEIIGDCFDFANDKKNMYIRQEATKHIYQYNGMDILYDRDYTDLEEYHRPIETLSGAYDRSTLFPLYYGRQDTFNEIEDYYHLKDDISTKDFSNMAGAEIVRYDTLDEYRIWNHSKAVDMRKYSRLRGNMQYKEDKWCVQINPINLVQANEPTWTNDLVPVELRYSPIPDEIKEQGSIEVPDDDEWKGRGFITWNKVKLGQVKVKDKWVKIRVRYTGDKLAIIHAITTLFSISYA